MAAIATDAFPLEGPELLARAQEYMAPARTGEAARLEEVSDLIYGGPEMRAWADAHRGAIRAEEAAQADILRDIFANPFRATGFDPVWRAWNDGGLVKIAQGILGERAFDRMPIVADALLDAGCDNEELIAHCRSGGDHVRGCWALDLILGRA